MKKAVYNNYSYFTGPVTSTAAVVLNAFEGHYTISNKDKFMHVIKLYHNMYSIENIIRSIYCSFTGPHKRIKVHYSLWPRFDRIVFVPVQRNINFSFPHENFKGIQFV